MAAFRSRNISFCFERLNGPLEIVESTAESDPKLNWQFDGVMNGSDRTTGCADVAGIVGRP